MKKFTASILAVFIFASLFAQKSHLPSPIHEKSVFNKYVLNPNLRNIPADYGFNNQKKTYFHQKDASVTSQRFDSIVDPEVFKQAYEYSENGSLLNEAYYEWGTVRWKGTDKYEYKHDSNNRIIERIAYIGDNYKWKQSQKEEQIYDNDKIIQVNTFGWMSGRWLKENIVDYTYDENENMILRSNSIKEGANWIVVNKTEHVFDSIGNQTHSNYYYLENDQLINTSVSEYTFDSLGNIVLIQSFTRLYDRLVNSWKREWEYDSGGSEVINTYSEWDGDLWLKRNKTESIINKNNVQTYYTRFIWENEEWVNSQKYESVFDDMGNRSQYSYSNWNGTQWVSDYKSDQVYDNEFTIDDLTLPFTMPNSPDLELLFHHKLIQLTYSRYNSFEWVIERDYSLYYSEQNYTVVNDVKIENQISVYPNPATNQITFNLKGVVGENFIELFDTQGNLVKSQYVDNNKMISVASLRSGLYFYRILNNKEYYQGRFIVK